MILSLKNPSRASDSTCIVRILFTEHQDRVHLDVDVHSPRHRTPSKTPTKSRPLFLPASINIHQPLPNHSWVNPAIGLQQLRLPARAEMLQLDMTPTTASESGTDASSKHSWDSWGWKWEWIKMWNDSGKKTAQDRMDYSVEKIGKNIPVESVE